MFSRQDLGAQFRAFGLALGVHILMALLVVVSTMRWEPFRKPQNLGLTIEAVIVDTSEIRNTIQQPLDELDELKRAASSLVDLDPVADPVAVADPELKPETPKQTDSP